MIGRCPCGSNKPIAICCRPWHAGGEPPDAPTLMRSRFSAYAVGDVAYLWRTLHHEHPDRAESYDSWAARVAAEIAALRFRKLTVLATRDPIDGIAHVLFHADIREGTHKRSFAEHSRFAHDGVGWRYLDGVSQPERDLPRPIEALTFDAFHLAARR